MALGADEINGRFGFHPATADTAPQHAEIRECCKHLAYQLDDMLPDGRQKSLAFTKLEEVMYHSNAAIAMTAPLSDKPQIANPQH